MSNKSLFKLIDFIEKENFKGWDPYDTLNSFINFKFFGGIIPVLAIQFQKRNPVNIRSLLGVKKGINPKGMGLILKAYCILYKKTGEKKFLDKATSLFGWLKDNYSVGYSGYAWGYNFDWASVGSYLKAYTPSVVVTSFVIDGVFEYFLITNDNSAKTVILSAANYVRSDIPVVELEKGITYSYTHLEKDCCYNASLLAAEILAKADKISNSNHHNENINLAIDFVLSKQKAEGEWWYSYNPKDNSERKQIDFHQGFVLVSLYNLNKLLSDPRKDVNDSIKQGLEYYRKNQFFDNGQSLWRIPKKWPVEIHNQSQGIITFAKLKEFDKSYADFAKTIAEWTIKNMQSRKGFFYYRKNKAITNKIPFIRWSQAWMFLCLAELMEG